MASLEELRERFERPIELADSPVGKLRLSAVTNEVATFITELLESKASDRAFAEQLVQYLAEEPRLDLNAVKQWTDELLLAVALAWAEEINRRHGRMPVKRASFADFKKAVERYLFPIIDLAVEKFANAALGTSLVSEAIQNAGRDWVGPSIVRDWIDGVQSTLTHSGWLEANKAADMWATDLLRSSALDALGGSYKNFLDDISLHEKMARDLAVSNAAAGFLGSGINQMWEEQRKLADIVGSFGMSAGIEQAFSGPAKEIASFLDTMRADEVLSGHLARHVSSTNEIARAIGDFARLTPSIEVPASVLEMTKAFSDLEQIWRESASVTLRIGAPILDSAAALFEQDWLFNSPTSPLVAELQIEADAQEVLAEHDFGFIVQYLLEWTTVRLLAERRGQGKSEVRIVRQLTRESQSTSFRQALGEMFQQMDTLPWSVRMIVKPRSRWRVIDQALDAHSRRHYFTSVPTLIAQVDGLLTCFLVARQELWPGKDNKGRKVYKGKDYTKPNAPVVDTRGLGSRLACSQLQNDPMLSALRRVIAERVDKRNGVLHGDDTDYGSAKLSTQLVWTLAALAFQLAIIAENHSLELEAKRAS